MVRYYYELNDESTLLIEDAKPPGPDRLRDWIGIDYFADVKSIGFYDEKVTDIAPLAVLTDLQALNLSETSVTDLSPLAGITGMRNWDRETCGPGNGPGSRSSTPTRTRQPDRASVPSQATDQRQANGQNLDRVRRRPQFPPASDSP